MTKRFTSRLLHKLYQSYLYVYRHRGLWLRCLLCWGIGCFVLTNDEKSSFDTRFQLRGDQRVSSSIVLITMKPNDVFIGSKLGILGMQARPENADITDSYYWTPVLWKNLLEKLLKQQPHAIGVTFFFGDKVMTSKLHNEEINLFRNPKIIWSSLAYNVDAPSLPFFAAYDNSNVGTNDLLREEDGIIRRYQPIATGIGHLAEKITGVHLPTEATQNSGRFINYRGGGRLFTEFSVSDILSDSLPPEALKDKIIVIGPENTQEYNYLTPLGSLNRGQIVAQIADNLLEGRWIKRLPTWIYVIELLVLMLLVVYLMSHFPHSVAFVLMLWLATLIAALSAWVFDSFYVWLPVVSPLIMLFTIWIVLIGYQATTIEKRNWELKQERKYLEELEQLKNNFVSLISHDLKTPIAKNQAVVERLLDAHETQPLRSDLLSLQKNNDELNKYIQSILKVLRLESREFRLVKEVADLNELIVDAITQLNPLAAEKNITIETQLEPMFSIEVDATLIREVIINLIENAIKYTPEGGHITIHSREVNNQVEVEVVDNGEGIKPEDLKSVWQKFTRGSNQDLKTKGTGLGLYLVKYFIELHGGKVTLDSIWQKGTKVGFTLPLDLEGESENTYSANINS